jgi:cytochrome c biogenesis factor
MRLNDSVTLDTTRLMLLMSFCIFIVSTWLALRAKTLRATRVASCLSVVSGFTFAFYAFLAPIPN